LHIEVGEPGLDCLALAHGDGLGVVLQVGLQDLTDVHEVLESGAAADAGDERLAFAQDVFDIGGRFVCELHDARGSVDEPAIHRVPLHDLCVPLDTEARGQEANRVCQERLAADFFEFVRAGELVGNGYLVDCLVTAPESEACLVDPGVLLAKEVAGVEDWGATIHGVGVDHCSRNDRLLRLNIMRRELLEGVTHGQEG
jgi:hypothetical protein